jgi:hypothetical protein
MHMGAFSTRTCLLLPYPPPPPLSLTTPFKCDKKGRWPARHFHPLTPPPPPPPLDYGQILAASPKVEDDLYFGECEYDS